MNEPAFPGQWDHGPSGIQSFSGMTLRDYFAAKAMQGILSDPNIAIPRQKTAEWAYGIADAMIKERDEKK